MKNNIVTVIHEIRGNQLIRTVDEASIKQGVILRILSVLDWNTFDTEEVKPEYTVDKKRVDLSLRVHNTNKVFIEAKRPNVDLENHQKQLLQYSFDHGVRLAILTNGVTWWFYLPLTEGSWEERRFYSADLFEQEPESIAERFMELLSKENVISGNAAKNAEHLYTSKQRRTALKNALPRAWSKITSEPDDLLVELLSDTAEKISGFRPEMDDVKKYIRESISLNRNIATPYESGAVSSNRSRPVTHPSSEHQIVPDERTDFEIYLTPAFLKWGGFSVRNSFRRFLPKIDEESGKAKRSKDFFIDFEGYGQVKVYRSQPGRIKVSDRGVFVELKVRYGLNEKSVFSVSVVESDRYYSAILK
ncbi:MAG: hypothetical protein L3J71_15155 [Victivallaceae bacterium]|nr:hypothetical protein [Victivallaceae bacterium]